MSTVGTPLEIFTWIFLVDSQTLPESLKWYHSADKARENLMNAPEGT